MRDTRLLAGDNVAVLQQGIDLLRRLDDRLYAADPVRPARDGVGKQFRHLVDFYHCFLNGLDELRIDYSRRERDPRLEQDRGFAIESFESLIDRLQGLPADRGDAEMWVKVDRLAGDDARDLWSRSSVMRELQFLMSHTIHHYALIKWLLRMQGFEVHQDFGVAPSTLQHWREISLSTR